MTNLFAGIALFGGAHLFVMLLPGRRDALKARLGENGWKGLFTLVSLIGLALMIWGLMRSRAGPLAADWLYIPADWARHAAMLLVLLAFVAIAASHGKGHLKLMLRNPMSIGIALWAFGHLLANGKRADVYFFATFLGLALLDIGLSEWRGRKPGFAPQLRPDIVAAVAGVLLYVIFLYGFHPYVLNLPVAG